MRQIKRLQRAIAKQPQTPAVEYLGLALAYYAAAGHAPDTVATLKRALAKFEPATVVKD